MVLNYIWIAFFVIAFVVAVCKLLFFGDTQIFTEIINSTFDSSKTAFEISLGLTGVLSLWLGVMKIGENSGLINALSRWLSPVFCRLFPDIPKGHPVMGSIFMNMSANMLGLDNAATPMGLKAMKELQELNPKKDTASNPMIMFLVINTSGLIIIPISIMVYRAQMGAAQPTDIFIPILLSTFISTLVGVIAVSISQRINLINKAILTLMGCLSLFFGGIIYLTTTLSREEMGVYSTLIANVILFSVILLFIIAGIRKKINVYDSFVEGAKEGFTTAVRIIPYLVAFLVGNRCFPHFGCHGYTGRRHWGNRRILRTGHRLCGSTANGLNEVTERQRCQWPDDRHHETVWTRFICRTCQLCRSRCIGHHLLYFSSIFWKRRHHENT